MEDQSDRFGTRRFPIAALGLVVNLAYWARGGKLNRAAVTLALGFGLMLCGSFARSKRLYYAIVAAGFAVIALSYWLRL